jgi:drug/metabolite transporter (DMT)-like permease
VFLRSRCTVALFGAFCFFGLLLALPFALPQWTPISASLWPAVIAVGVLSFAAQFLYTYGMGFTTASSGAAMTQLTPVLTWVISVFLLDEIPRALSIAGAGLCALGLLLGLIRAATPQHPVTRGPQATAGKTETQREGV